MEGDKVAEIVSPISGQTDQLSNSPVPDGIKMPQETDKDVVRDEDNLSLDHDRQYNRDYCDEAPCTLEESRCLKEDDDVIIKVHLEDGQNAEDEGGEGDDEEHQEEEEPEMTPEQMKAMYNAVRTGNIDLLDDLLDLPGANINMEWFSENLLMTALRNGQTQMAMFLIDNGIDYNYTTTHMDKDDTSGVIDWYTVDCRQVAYEMELWDIVDIIDEKNGKLWPHSARKRRHIRYKKTPEMKIKEREERVEYENGRELADSEGGRTSNRSEMSEFSDVSSVDLTEVGNLDQTVDEDISDRGHSSEEQPSDVSVERFSDGNEEGRDEDGVREIGDDDVLDAIDSSIQKIDYTSMDQIINSKLAGDSNAQMAGDDNVQEAGDDIGQLAKDKHDKNVQETGSVMRHSDDNVQHRGNNMQNKGDINVQHRGDNKQGHTTDGIKEHREENKTGVSYTNKAGANKTGVDMSGFTKVKDSSDGDKVQPVAKNRKQKHVADDGKEGLSISERDTRGHELKDSASATKPSGFAGDNVSSGYSTLSSRESQPELASVQPDPKPKRVTPQIGTTKSYLSRKTANACLRSTVAAISELPPIRTISGIGSFNQERKLWIADSGSQRPTSEGSRRRHPDIVTYRPWSDSKDTRIYEMRSTEYRNLVRLHGDKLNRQHMNTRPGTGRYVMPEGFKMRRANSDLLTYSSAELTHHKLRSSRVVLEMPVTTKYIQLPQYRPLTRATGRLRSRDIGESSLTEMTSVIRNRMVVGSPRELGARLLRLKKYSPAGHLKYTTKKHYI